MLEIGIVLATVTAAFFTYQINSQIAAEDRRIAEEADEDRDEAIEAQLRSIRQASETAVERNRIDVLTVWLPRFLEGDDHAERMILTLLPAEQATQLFNQLTNDVATATIGDDDEPADPDDQVQVDDGDEELAAAVDRATINASRAEASTDEFAIVVATEADQDRAEALKGDLESSGVSAVEVVQNGAAFDVLVTGFASEEDAEEVRSLLDDLSTLDIGSESNDAAEIVNVAVVAPSGGLQRVPDVYNCAEPDAVKALADAGFVDVRVWRISSNSLDEGQVRELVLHDGSAVADETEVVNTFGFGDLNDPDADGGRGAGLLEELGSVEVDTNGEIASVSLPVDTPLALKVSNDPRGDGTPSRACGLG